MILSPYARIQTGKASFGGNDVISFRVKYRQCLAPSQCKLRSGLVVVEKVVVSLAKREHRRRYLLKRSVCASFMCTCSKDVSNAATRDWDLAYLIRDQQRALSDSGLSAKSAHDAANSKGLSAHIKIAAVGTSGGRMLDSMTRTGSLRDCDCRAMNTDLQALQSCSASHKIQLGACLTKGLGTGGNRSVGAQAAKSAQADIKAAVEGTGVFFAIAAMGGGTGGGATPVVMEFARAAGRLGIGIVTKPFAFEAPRRRKQAEEDIQTMRACSDALVVIDQDHLLEQGTSTTLAEASELATEAALRSIKAFSCLLHSKDNLAAYGFEEEVKMWEVLKDAGQMHFGFGSARTAKLAVKEAFLSCPTDVDRKAGRIVLCTLASSPPLPRAIVDGAIAMLQPLVGAGARIVVCSVLAAPDARDPAAVEATILLGVPQSETAVAPAQKSVHMNGRMWSKGMGTDRGNEADVAAPTAAGTGPSPPQPMTSLGFGGGGGSAEVRPDVRNIASWQDAGARWGRTGGETPAVMRGNNYMAEQGRRDPRGPDASDAHGSRSDRHRGTQLGAVQGAEPQNERGTTETPWWRVQREAAARGGGRRKGRAGFGSGQSIPGVEEGWGIWREPPNAHVAHPHAPGLGGAFGGGEGQAGGGPFLPGFGSVLEWCRGVVGSRWMEEEPAWAEEQRPGSIKERARRVLRKDEGRGNAHHRLSLEGVGTYTGPCCSGVPEGQGTMSYSTGETYQGMWHEGIRHGWGIFSYANGDVFEGDWKDNMQDGEGWLHFARGDKLHGFFQEGRVHGPGVIYFASGAIFEGEFCNNYRHGHAVFVDPQGERWSEHWEHGVRVSCTLWELQEEFAAPL